MFSKNLKYDIRIVAAMASILLTAWCIYIDPVINNDGYLYILLADLVKSGNYSDVFSIFRWPFYSFIIAGLSGLTGLSSELSAYLLNAIFTMIIVTGYLSIIKTLGGDQRVLVIACIVILIFPGINRYRDLISRDFGYLAFYMLGLLVFFRHLVKPQWYWPVAWSGLLALAALFRIEAVVFLVCLPFIASFVTAETKSQRIKVASLFAIGAIAILLIFSWWFAGSHLNTTSTPGAGSAYKLAGVFIEGLMTDFSVKLGQMQDLFSPYSKNYAQTILLAAGFIILFSEITKSVTLPYLFLVFYDWKTITIFENSRIKNAWLLLILVHLLILSGVIVRNFFISGRVSIALSLTILIAIPFILSSLYQKWQQHKIEKTSEKWVYSIAIIVILAVSIHPLIVFSQKNYYKEGGLWLKQNLSEDERLLSNVNAVNYYANRNPYIHPDGSKWTSRFTYDLDVVINILKKNKAKNYQYIAVDFKRRDKDRKYEIIGLVGSDPVKRLKNKSGDELLIFKN